MVAASLPKWDDQKWKVAGVGSLLLFAAHLVPEMSAPHLPPGDGPIQMMNWLGRLDGGEVPGRDFPVFHGVGVLWLHVPLHAMGGGGLTGLGLTYAGTSLLLVGLLLVGASRLGGLGWWASVGLGVGVAVMLVNMPEKVSQFFAPGHSVIGARAASGLLGVGLVWWLAVRSTRPVVVRWALAAGVMGLVSTVGVDQMAAVLAGGCVAWMLGLGWRGWPWLVLLPVAAVGIFYGALEVMTLGRADLALDYAFRAVPEDQFWWFGSPPVPVVRLWRDLVLYPVLLAALGGWAGVGLLGWRTGRWEGGFGVLGSAVLVAGLAGCLPMLAIRSPHYASGLVIGLVAAAVIIGLRLGQTRVGRTEERGVRRWQTLVVGLAPVFALSLMGPGWLRRLGREVPDPDLGQLAMLLRDHQRPNRAPVVWSLYRGLGEEQLRLKRPMEWDYMIHAVGRNRREDYERAFELAEPDVVRMIRPDRFDFHGWLWHTRWGFFGKLVEGYRPAVVGEVYVDWVREESVRRPAARALDAGWRDGVAGHWRIPTEGLGEGTVVEIGLEYRQQVEGIRGAVQERLTRMVVHQDGGGLGMVSFGLPPARVSGGCFEWAVIVDGSGRPVDGEVEVSGLAGAAEPEWTRVTAVARGRLGPEAQRALTGVGLAE